jgi:hypothetical protein
MPTGWIERCLPSTGSAINEVAQNSLAAEPYLVEFTSRPVGAGNRAKMSVSQIIGPGSVLDQNAQQVEMSSAALSGLIMKLYGESAKFVKTAGLEVKSFTGLLRKDANGSLLTLLETLSKKGGMADLAPVSDEMKLDGARAAAILSVPAGNIEQIRKERETATGAFNEGTSVINEYGVKNNTLQASLEKAKKRFQEPVYELGEKLAPHMSIFISTGGSMVKIISTITGFLLENGKTVIWITGIIGSYLAGVLALNAGLKAYTLYQKTAATVTAVFRLATLAHTGAIAASTMNTVRATVAMKEYCTVLQSNSLASKIYLNATSLLSAGNALLHGNIKKAAAAVRTFNTELKANPFGFVAAAPAGVTGGLILLHSRLKSNAEKLKEFAVTTEDIKKATGQYSDKISEERTKLNALILSITGANEKSELRKKIPGAVKIRISTIYQIY